MLAKRDIGNIWDKRSNGTYDFVYLVSIVLKSVVDGRLIDQRACGMGAVRLGAKTGFGMGRSLG